VGLRRPDAHIVRGLFAILFAIYSGKTADDVLGTDAQAIFAELGLGARDATAFERVRRYGRAHPFGRTGHGGSAARARTSCSITN
jgi:Fe-S metabolism associated domain